MYYTAITPGNRLSKQAGFSLLEILIVVTILGVTALVAIPQLSPTRNTKLDLAAEEVAQAMRFARSETLRTGKPHGFELLFDELSTSSDKAEAEAEAETGVVAGPERSIRVFRVNTAVTPWTSTIVYHPIRKTRYHIDFELQSFVEIGDITSSRLYRNSSSNSACGSVTSVYFDSKGTPWCFNPSTSLLVSYQVSMTLDKYSRVVTLHGITGRVTIE